MSFGGTTVSVVLLTTVVSCGERPSSPGTPSQPSLSFWYRDSLTPDLVHLEFDYVLICIVENLYTSL